MEFSMKSLITESSNSGIIERISKLFSKQNPILYVVLFINVLQFACNETDIKKNHENSPDVKKIYC